MGDYRDAEMQEDGVREWKGVFRYPNVRTLYTFMAFNTVGRATWDGQVFPAYVYLVSGESNAAVGMLAGVNGLTQIIVGPVLGYLSDKYDRVKVLKASACVGLLAVSCMATAVYTTSRYEALIPSMILWGCFNSSLGPTMDSLLADTTSDGERSEVFTYQTMIRQTGGIAGPVLSIFMFVYMGNTWDVWRCRNVMVSGLAVCFIAVCVLFQVQGSENAAHTGAGAGAQSYEMVALTEDDDAGEDGEEEKDQKDLTWVEDGQKGNRRAGEVAVAHVPSPTSLSQGEFEQRQRNTKMAEARCLCPCISMDVSYVAAMIALSDIITGLASGMTIKFFPIFFIDVVGMHPVELSVLFMLSPVACSLCLWANQNYTRKWLGRIWNPRPTQGRGHL